MTATTSLPPHPGSANGYRRGCRCPGCTAAATRDKKRRQLFGPTTSSPQTVLPKLQVLLDSGASIQSIATAAGCDRTTLQRILHGDYQSVQQGTRDRILAVTTAAPMGSVSALGATRQVRALIAARHSLTTIAGQARLNHSIISELANGRRTVIRASTAYALQEAYKVLAATVGTSPRSASRAAREGWAVPSAWDGIDMANPEAFPDFTSHCGSTKGYWLHRSSGIPYCQPCRDAVAKAKRERKAARTAESQGLAA